MRCAVLGDPITHSLSPALHRAGYAAAGLTGWSYDAVRVPAGGVRGFVEALDATWRGLSVTAPLKREVLVLATEVTERARLAGAANTLVIGPEGRLADNTDLPGAVAAVRERYAGPVTSATVLGAGATAASTGLALVELGARSVTLLARSPERAAETAAVIAAHPSAPRVRVGSLALDPVVGEVVVSTVPAQAQTEDLVARCGAAAVVFEALYAPWPTPLSRSAADRALVGGLDLLVHQAALQFTMFTGLPAPLEQMRAAGEQALAERSAR
ncbi:shikimate dehydrogenase [Nocardioides sp. W7]|uniref:shikimate dehydrogenase n=1 Tax=Nocardioides sp. W7 TaxID=2931390 RepID=UPI001FD3CDB3|nr:shikimate dehydrogenase [Nocardioides sp. W7]